MAILSTGELSSGNGSSSVTGAWSLLIVMMAKCESHGRIGPLFKDGNILENDPLRGTSAWSGAPSALQIVLAPTSFRILVKIVAIAWQLKVTSIDQVLQPYIVSFFDRHPNITLREMMRGPTQPMQHNSFYHRTTADFYAIHLVLRIQIHSSTIVTFFRDGLISWSKDCGQPYDLLQRSSRRREIIKKIIISRYRRCTAAGMYDV